MAWSVQNNPVLLAGNTLVINPSGEFLYNGVPALGNLVASNAPAAGTDQFGNQFFAGICSYNQASNPVVISQLTGGQVFVGNITDIGNEGTYHPGGLTNALGVSGQATLFSGQTAAGDNQAFVQAQSQNNSGLANGQLLLGSSKVIIGGQQLAVWDETAVPPQMVWPAGGGPFVTGETFHTVSLATGTTGQLSGGIGMRVKKLPWNMIYMDVEFTYTSTGGTTFVFGSLPDSTYYPNVARRPPLSTNGQISSTTVGVPRLFIPTSGGISVIVPTMNSSATYNIGGTIMYPTN